MSPTTRFKGSVRSTSVRERDRHALVKIYQQPDRAVEVQEPRRLLNMAKTATAAMRPRTTQTPPERVFAKRVIQLRQALEKVEHVRDELLADWTKRLPGVEILSNGHDFVITCSCSNPEETELIVQALEHFVPVDEDIPF